MNVLGFPILTLLTVLPLIGAALALFSGRHARVVALLTTLACVLVSLFIWTGYFFGTIGFIKRNFSYVIIAIVLISIVPIVWKSLSERRKNKAASLNAGVGQEVPEE